MQYTTSYESPLGSMTLASDGESLTGLWFMGQKYYASTLKEEKAVEAVVSEEIAGDKLLPVFQEARKWLDIYFSGKEPNFTPKLRLEGTFFQQKVWKVLLAIPYGETVTYGDIAKRLAAKEGKEKMSAQAVGGAVGHNPISIIVPCHRVVGTSGSLTGYAGGIDRKVKLLALEKVDLSKFTVPTKGTAL